VAKFLRIQPNKEREAAGLVATESKFGLAVVPLLGGYGALGLSADRLPAEFGTPVRLVRDVSDLSGELALLAADRRERVERMMHLAVAGRFATREEPLALVVEPLGVELLALLPQAWLAVPDEQMEPGELADELGRGAAVVLTGPAAGPGPTFVDLRTQPAVIDRRGKLGILELEYELGEPVRMERGLAFSVLVVCTGNSCRSPMAQAMLASLLADVPAFVYSAGTGAPVGARATSAAAEVMREMDIDLSAHRAQQLEAGLIRGADLILVMERRHREAVLDLVPEAALRTRLLLEYSGGTEEVEDPIGRSLEFYRRTARQMLAAVEQVAADVRTRAGRGARTAGIQTKEQ
jgi:protein-tyrosine-phosphatase